MQFHDQKKNLQTKLNVDLSTEKKMMFEDLNQKINKRTTKLQNVYHERYISDNENENDISSNSSASKTIKIRSHNLTLHYCKLSDNK